MEEDLASEADSVESVVVERILEMVEDGRAVLSLQYEYGARRLWTGRT